MFRGRPPSAAFKIYADKRTLGLAFARKIFQSHLNLSFRAKFDRSKRVLGPFIQLRVKYYGSFYNGNQSLLDAIPINMHCLFSRLVALNKMVCHF